MRAKLIPVLLLITLSGVAVAGYLAWTYASGLLGFPLDDAWIHQTYARNLAQSGQLAYLPGQPSAGSTSPAWSFLLSVSYLLGLDFRVWAFLLGALARMNYEGPLNLEFLETSGKYPEIIAMIRNFGDEGRSP